MRLLYLTEEAIGFEDSLVRGGAIHVRRVLEGLSDRGHDVVLLDWNERPDRDFQRSVRPRTRFVDGPLRSAWRGARLARRRDVDVVVSKTRKTYLPGLLVARAAGVPHLVHVGAVPRPGRRNLLGRLDAASFSLRLRLPHDGYLLVCEWVHEALSLPADRSHVVGNAVDTDRFHPERSPPRPEGLADALAGLSADLLVGYVGGLTRVKGLEDLAAALGRSDVDAAAVVAGDGPRRDALERAFGDDARFLGAVPYEAVPAVYDAVDVFCLPSHAEGLPRVLLEAQATATPAVATRVGCVPEVVDDGDTGLLYDPGDVDGLVGALADLADPALRERLGAAGRRTVVDGWSWDRLLDRYETALRDVTARKG